MVCFLAVIVFLGKHCTNTHITGICIQDKWLAIVGVGQYWGSGKVLLKLIKSCLTFNSPFECDLVFSELVQGSSSLSKVLNKSSVIPSKA